MPIQISLNGETKEMPDGQTLSGLVKSLGLAPERIAVEHNLRILQRGHWLETVLAEGDRIEIVHFVGGGRGVPSSVRRHS